MSKFLKISILLFSLTLTSCGNKNNGISSTSQQNQKYEISYNLNGGTNDIENPNYLYSNEEIVLKNPHQKYHTFEGWYDNKDFNGDKISFLKEDKNVTLYAKWSKGTEGLKYELINDHYVVKEYIGEDTDVFIPNTYKDVKVTCIGDLLGGKVDTNNIIKNLTIDEGIEMIRSYSFSECKELETVKLPESMRDLDIYCFSECPKLKSINLPDNIHGLNISCFYKCTSLEHITLPKNDDFYCNDAFMRCSNLKSIVIKSGTVLKSRLCIDGCPNLNIFCEDTSKPESWDNNWVYDENYGFPTERVHWKGSWKYDSNNNPVLIS